MRRETISPDVQMTLKAMMMMGATASGAAFGFGFWLTAAHLLSSEAVGAGSSAIAAASLAAMLAECGVGTFLVERLPRSEERPALIAAAMAAAGVAAVLAAAGVSFFAVAAADAGYGAPHWSGGGALLVPAVALTVALGSVCDQACYGILRTSIAFERSLVASAGKLLLLPILALGGRLAGEAALSLSWTLGGLASLAWVAWRVRARMPSGGWRGGAGLDRHVARRLAGHHALNVASSAAGLGLPILASACLGSASSAPVYVAWLIASTAFLAPAALAGVLLAMGNDVLVTRVDRLRFSMQASLAVSAATSLMLPLVGPLVLSPFGERYASASTELALFGLAAVPNALRHNFIAIRRFAGTMATASGAFAMGAVLELAAAAAGAAVAGATGLCVGWVVAVWIQGIVMTPALLAGTRMAAPVPGEAFR